MSLAEPALAMIHRLMNVHVAGDPCGTSDPPCGLRNLSAQAARSSEFEKGLAAEHSTSYGGDVYERYHRAPDVQQNSRVTEPHRQTAPRDVQVARATTTPAWKFPLWSSAFCIVWPDQSRELCRRCRVPARTVGTLAGALESVPSGMVHRIRRPHGRPCAAGKIRSRFSRDFMAAMVLTAAYEG